MRPPRGGEAVMDGSKTWVAIHPDCGGWRILVVECEQTKREVRELVRDAQKYGLDINKVDTQDIRSGVVPMCDCKREKRNKQRSLPLEVQS
jgi:hypothetical protein